MRTVAVPNAELDGRGFPFHVLCGEPAEGRKRPVSPVDLEDHGWARQGFRELYGGDFAALLVVLSTKKYF